ncbi:MAG: NADH-quinone oxidoreductase subunit D [Acidobacteria bacterium]|nr:NADH-quinone oxidoreductase subunit D [Acidobacteriota bacterium]
MLTFLPSRSHLDSFYHLDADPVPTACRGLACFVARHLNAPAWREATAHSERVYCLGKCYAAPACTDEDQRPRVEVHASTPVLLGRVLGGGAPGIDRYIKRQGYRALELALRQSPEHLIQTISESGLRGRGGAGVPTGRKWDAVFRERSNEKFVIANADEGDPGAFMERVLLEEDPHSLIEAMVIAGFAVNAARGIIYLRKEYPRAAVMLREAIQDARRKGILGSNILGRRFCFDVELAIGRGSYVCGEESALLNALEGKRPEPRQRPPYASESGLYGKPTLINNVETFANVPWIILNGADAYSRLGCSTSKGTKLISLNSLFRRPGLYEVEFGVTVRHVVEQIGGGLAGELKGVIIGGPLAGIVPPHLLDTPFAFEELRLIGASVGHGGIVAFDEHTSIRELIHHMFEFGAYESCGKCTPCRVGTRRIEKLFARAWFNEAEDAEWREIVRAMSLTSFCGMGTGLAEFAQSAIRYYAEELALC